MAPKLPFTFQMIDKVFAELLNCKALGVVRFNDPGKRKQHKVDKTT